MDRVPFPPPRDIRNVCLVYIYLWNYIIAQCHKEFRWGAPQNVIQILIFIYSIHSILLYITQSTSLRKTFLNLFTTALEVGFVFKFTERDSDANQRKNGLAADAWRVMPVPCKRNSGINNIIPWGERLYPVVLHVPVSFSLSLSLTPFVVFGSLLRCFSSHGRKEQKPPDVYPARCWIIKPKKIYRAIVVYPGALIAEEPRILKTLIKKWEGAEIQFWHRWQLL